MVLVAVATALGATPAQSAPSAPPGSGAAAADDAPAPGGATPNSTSSPATALDLAIQARIISDPAFRRSFIENINARLAREPAFRQWFAQHVRARAAADPTFREIWTAGLRAGNDRLLANAGPATWTGNPIPSPRGGYLGPEVTQWASLVLSVMAEHNIDPHYLPGILAQIYQESRGNPNVVNVWDVNAQYGYASMGLLQITSHTYRSWGRQGYEGTLIQAYVPGSGRLQQFVTPWQTRPYTNLWAALNYVIGRYGYAKFVAWNGGANYAYSDGGATPIPAPAAVPLGEPPVPLVPLPR